MKQVFAFLIFCSNIASAQSFRGLAVLDDNTAWISGSKGHVLRTTNGALSWDTLSPKGYERKDFRDIHAWDKNTAIIMSSGDSAVILKTSDGGKNWMKVYEDNSPGVFLDAMDFDGGNGCVIGDPRKKASGKDTLWHFDILYSYNEGDTWFMDKGTGSFSVASPGEAMFAASGSNISYRYRIMHVPQVELKYVTGGLISRALSSRNPHLRDTLPFKKLDGCGAFSQTYEYNRWVIVGGCWQQANSRDSNCTYYDFKARKWMLSEVPPYGYRSCVTAHDSLDLLVCTGTNGTDISSDRAKIWKQTNLPGYNVCAFSSNYLWLAGDKGRIQRVKNSELRKP